MQAPSLEDPRVIDQIAEIFRTIQLGFVRHLDANPERALQKYLTPIRKKPLIDLDREAEVNTGWALEKLFGGRENLLVLGEESIDKRPDLSGETRIVALLDMLDGTDLLTRGFDNWCSAAVFHKKGEILAAFVALWREGIFFATRERSGAYRKPATLEQSAPAVSVRGPSAVKSLKGATICSYGQKPRNLLALVKNAKFCQTLEDLAARKAPMRFYNLAGNPMMIRLVDAVVRVDAVFDACGQSPHDFVPGAFIAKKAGATFVDLDGRAIDLAPLLLRPGHDESKQTYVLASTPDLTRKVVEIIR